jgi:hypothetical protein
MGNPVGDALKSANAALDNAKNFTSSVTGGKPSAIKAPTVTTPEKPDYSHAREARKSGEFMGVRSDEGGELKSALDNRDQAKKALTE